jgi:hypothetical protein
VTDDDITAVLDRLVGGLDDEVGDWHDILERSARPVHTVEGSLLRRRRRPWRSGGGALLLGATVIVTALVVLIVASSWRGGPTILERAAAALPAPTSGQILYESIALRFKGHPVTHIHLGLAGAPPHRFRVTSDGIPTADVGGTLRGVTGLSYDSSSGDLIPVAFGFRVSQSDLDPAAFIRAALASGRAQLDGKTTIRGHDVLRIRVNSNLYGRSVLIALYFVDAHTYRPLRVVFTPGSRTGASLRDLPQSSSSSSRTEGLTPCRSATR